jgi:putative colanic acid biosynthesis acetyltransferase WcaF
MSQSPLPLASAPGLRFRNPYGLRNKVLRSLWSVVYWLFFRPSPRQAHKFRVLLLRLFGGTISWTALPYPKCRIWAPWNLVMDDNSCIANDVDCYNAASITLKADSIVSQYAYLCSASHDYNDPNFTLFSLPITIGRLAWVAARAYIGPGVELGEGSIAGANACVYKDVPAWTIVGGNPARRIATRTLRDPLTTLHQAGGSE